VGYACCRTNFHTIIICFILSHYLYTNYTTEVISSSGRVEKFNGRPGTISLREFKLTFSIVVCELEFKYGANYTEAFAFKQLARYVHYEAFRCLRATFSKDFGHHPDPQSSLCHRHHHSFQVALQATITHHGIMPNNLDLVLILVNLSLQ